MSELLTLQMTRLDDDDYVSRIINFVYIIEPWNSLLDHSQKVRLYIMFDTLFVHFLLNNIIYFFNFYFFLDFKGWESWSQWVNEVI